MCVYRERERESERESPFSYIMAGTFDRELNIGLLKATALICIRFYANVQVLEYKVFT